MVPASAATMLKKSGYKVVWMDGIWEDQKYAVWQENLIKQKPDLLALETKTPVVKLHWKIIDKIKKSNPNIKIVLFGDHVTTLPNESMENCLTDYVLTGGDYDFLLLNLCNYLTKKEKLEPGIWYRSKGKIANSGEFSLNHDLNSLSPIDRDLTKWKLYAYKNTNYCRIPGTYTMFGRDCYWGRCSFCSWTTLYPGSKYRQISVKKALDEVGSLIENYNIREIMDDSGTFPIGDWLREFCNGMIERGYSKKIRMSCNMRFNSGLTETDYQLMGKAGFRFLLYGLESVNQNTLDKINKNLKVSQIKPALKWAKKAGLKPHLTVMIGYPWETKKEAKKTLGFAKEIFEEGLADTLQATIIIPYPGTPLFKEAKKMGWLKTKDWERYDMREPILKTKMTDGEIKELVQGFYKSIFNHKWILRKAKEGLTDWDTFKYYWRMTLKLPSKLIDFSTK